MLLPCSLNLFRWKYFINNSNIKTIPAFCAWSLQCKFLNFSLNFLHHESYKRNGKIKLLYFSGLKNFIRMPSVYNHELRLCRYTTICKWHEVFVHIKYNQEQGSHLVRLCAFCEQDCHSYFQPFLPLVTRALTTDYAIVNNYLW